MTESILFLSQRKIPEGYYPGAAAQYSITGEKAWVCDVCEIEASWVYGYENNHQNNPDLWICDDCHQQWIEEHWGYD